MTWPFENPWPSILVGGLVEIGLIAALWYTGRGVLLYAMAAVAMLTGGLVLLERVVVTQRERVHERLFAAAAAVEKNDVDAVLSFVSPNAEVLRSVIRNMLPHMHVDSVSIRNPTITLNDLTSPPSARAEFQVAVTGHGVNQGIPFQGSSLPLSFSVVFERIDNQWFISDYREQSGLVPPR